MTDYAIYNPHEQDVATLPVIYGFNNGGSPGFMFGQLIADDGTALGSHLCSHEFYMPGDLGVLAGRREDRHEGFREHYPHGYRMDFIPYDKVDSHPGLQAAFKLNAASAIEAAPAGETADAGSTEGESAAAESRDAHTSSAELYFSKGGVKDHG